MAPPFAEISQRNVLAGVAIAISMMSALLWMPATLGALSQGFGFDARALSHLAFAELLGFLLGTLFTNAKTITQLRLWVLVSCTVLVGANLVLLLFGPSVALVVLRLIAGLGSGVGFGYGLKLCGVSARPTRNFGLFTACMSLVMVVGFQVVAHLIESHETVDGIADASDFRSVARLVFGIYAGLASGAAVILSANQPLSAKASDQIQPHLGRRLEASVLICLLAIGLSFVGQGAIYAFLQTLGISHGFSVAGVANAMSAFAIMGIVGSLSAAALPGVVSRTAAIGIALFFLWIGLYALYEPASLMWYLGGCAIGGFYWNFALSLMLGLVARIDRSGQGSVLGGTMSSVGSTFGPLCAGLLIRGTEYQLVGWMVGVLCTAGLACVSVVERHSSRALYTR